VVDVDTLHRQYVDVRDVAGGKRETRLDLRAVDDKRAREPELGEVFPQHTGLAIFDGRLVEHDETAVLGLGRQRMLERQRAHLLRQVDRVATRGPAERAAGARETDP